MKGIDLRLAVARALALNGRDEQDYGKRVSSHLAATLAAQSDPEQMAASVKLHQEALSDPDKLRELNSIRLQFTHNYIQSSTNFLRLFFETVELKDDQVPYVQNNTMSEIAVGYLGPDGSPARVKIRPEQAEYQVPLRYLSSDKANWRLVDIQNGNISQSAQKTIDIAFDMANKQDQECFNLIGAPLNSGGALGTFTTTGSKPSRVYVANSRIVAGNLPDTNVITVAGSTNSTKFRYEVLSEVGRYASRWTNAFPEGGIFPTGRIVVPAVDIWDLSSTIVPSGSTSNPVADAMLLNGPTTPVDYMGKRWELIPDNTLPSGACYAQFNKPLGTVFKKPGLSRIYESTDDEKNIGTRFMKEVFSLVIPAQNRPYVAKIIYKV